MVLSGYTETKGSSGFHIQGQQNQCRPLDLQELSRESPVESVTENTDAEAKMTRSSVWLDCGCSFTPLGLSVPSCEVGTLIHLIHLRE